jgi:hypothetical protein
MSEVLGAGAIMKFVPRGQRFTGEELHSFNSRQKPLQGCGPVSTVDFIVEWLDDQAHTLGLTQRQFLFGFENTVCVD